MNKSTTRLHRLGILAAAVLLTFIPGKALAAGGMDDAGPLCPPAVYQRNTEDCLALGPSQYLTEMAEMGITFPQTPLPAIQPNPAWNEIEYTYARVKNEKAPIYKTYQDALKERSGQVSRRFSEGLNYVAYTDRAYAQGKTYYRTRWGWMSSKDLRPTEIPVFQGAEFLHTPEHDFGWVLNYFTRSGTVETKRTPGYAQDDYTGHFLDHLDMVTIYDQQRIDNRDWYLVGPEEWIVQTSIAKVSPRSGPPEGFTWDRWIEINLYEQTVAVYEDRELKYATIIASGDPPHWTYAGVFNIYQKLDVTRMRGRFPEDKSDNYDLDKVPWTMYFDEARAFHGAYWRALLGFPQSHGCVNMSLGDSHWIYAWAQEGDPVYVFDPSGRTPEK